MKKIATHHISRRMQAAAVGELNHCRVRIGVWVWCIRVARIDSDVMTRKPFDQLALCCDCPFFDVRCQPVGIDENKICNTCFPYSLAHSAAQTRAEMTTASVEC